MTDENLLGDIAKPAFRVIVAGSRRFCNYQEVTKVMDKVLAARKETHSIVIISGDCQGPDTLGRAYALENGYRIEVMEYDPSLGRNASTMRHQRMVENADAMVAFWDGRSDGTAKLLSLMYDAEKPIRIVEVDCIYQCVNRWVKYEEQMQDA